MRPSSRHKRLRQSQRFLGGQGAARAYGVGAIGPDPRRTMFLILCAVVGVAFLAFVIYSVIVFPGIFLIWAVYVAVERTTGIVVTDAGVAILARSEFNGRPRKLVALLPAGTLTDATIQRSGRYVHVPTYRLWLRKKEYDHLISVDRTTSTSTDPSVRSGLLQLGGVPASRVGSYAPAFATVQAPPSADPSWSAEWTESAPERKSSDSYWAGRTGRSPRSSDSEDDLTE